MIPQLGSVPLLQSLDLKGQRVLVRVDLDVSLSDSETLALHVDAALPTLRHLLGVGAQVIVAAHCSAHGEATVPSLEAAGALLAARLECDLYLPEDVVGDAALKVVSDLRGGQLTLLENLASEPGELSCDETFARKLATLCHAVVNDAPSLLDCKLASLIHLPRMVPVRALGLDLAHTLEGLRAIEALRGKLCCVFSSTTLSAHSLTELQRFSGGVDTLVIVDDAATAFAAAAQKNAPSAQSAAWPAETLAHCRGLISSAQTRDKKLLWMPPGLSPDAAAAWLSAKVPSGPVLLAGAWQPTELTSVLINALLTGRSWAGAVGTAAVSAVHASDPSLHGAVQLKCLRAAVVLRALLGEPLPVLNALSSAV